MREVNYAIYGINRVAKDFCYIFDNLNIVCFFDDEPFDSEFEGKPVYRFENIKQYRNLFHRLIVCDFDKKDKIENIVKMETDKNVHIPFCREEDFFDKLDDEKINPENKKIVVWGTGSRCSDLMSCLENIKIDYFINAKEDIDSFHNKAVKQPTDVLDWKEIFVIIAVSKCQDIKEFLIAQGLKENCDFCSSVSYISRASVMCRATMFDRSCYELDCQTMHNHIELGNKGEIFCCCTTFISNSLGSVEDKSVSEIWNSNIHKIMCLSTENRTYTFCKKDICPFFAGKKSDAELIDLHKPYQYMGKEPEVVALGFDATCNLNCITCRKSIYVAKDEELNRVMHYADIAIKQLLSGCRFLIMAGDGEVLLGQGYQKVYTNELADRISGIRLLTNGTLFNAKKWEEFSKNKTGKIMLTASIDAATKDTYEKIRRGGNFEHIMQNMAFAGNLRREGKLSYFRMNFVVQKENYKEMPLFVKWGKEIGCDEIFFTKILNWGTYTPEEFAEISMMQDDGVIPKPELIEIMENPIMHDSIVDMGTIQCMNEPIPGKQIKNYYMWELERKVTNLF